MATMRVVQVSRPNGPFEIVERPVPEPGTGSVRIKVQACGICHSDSLTKEGAYPGIQYPRVPGHEVAGVIDAVGGGIAEWHPGQRVGVGWNGGYCGRCDHCRRGEFFACVTGQVTGVTYDGGYGEYMIAPASAVALMPDELPPVEAAPLMCAGLTTFNALRNSAARPGDVVAVLGLGGLGHLGVQYAAKMGFRTVGIARGKDKEPLARQLGASEYIDSEAHDPAADSSNWAAPKSFWRRPPAARRSAPSKAASPLMARCWSSGRRPRCKYLPCSLLAGCRSIKGWYSGTSIDSQDTLAFSARNGVRSMNETFPLERASEAYDRMMSGKARFRVVLTIAGQAGPDAVAPPAMRASNGKGGTGMSKPRLLEKLEYFNMVHGVTLRAIGTFSDEELEFRRQAAMRSARELIFHIYTQEKVLAEAVKLGRLTMEAATASNPETEAVAQELKALATVSGARAYAEACHRAAENTLRGLSEEDLIRSLESPFGTYPAWRYFDFAYDEH